MTQDETRHSVLTDKLVVYITALVHSHGGAVYQRHSTAKFSVVRRKQLLHSCLRAPTLHRPARTRLPEEQRCLAQLLMECTLAQMLLVAPKLLWADAARAIRVYSIKLA